MEGLQILHSLPSDKKDEIANEFGSIEEFYKMVFDYYNEDYKLHKTKQSNYEAKQAEIQSKIFDIEEKLDGMELDGHSIVTEISSDHGEIIVNKIVKNADEYLKQFGTTFEKMREWLEKHTGSN